MLKDEYNCRLILEEFADNPFLPLFYKDPERFAFTVELFFMTERHEQMERSLLNQTGEKLRAMMPWITTKKIINKDKN